MVYSQAAAGLLRAAPPPERIPVYYSYIVVNFLSPRSFFLAGAGFDKSSSLMLSEQLRRGTTGSAVGLNVSNVGVNM